MNIYNFEWLMSNFESGMNYEFIFFWGHGCDIKISKSCLSQWFLSRFEVGDLIFQTAEHWMMYQKAQLFKNYNLAENILNSNNPKEVKNMGRDVIGFELSLWEKYKCQIVKIGNIHKFNQNNTLREFLLSTENSILVEASPNDSIWGIGLSEHDVNIDNIYAWQGLNLLGFILMEVRDFLRDFGTFTPLTNMLSPPWKKYPQYENSDMFWRMGKGEDYMIAYEEHYQSLSDKDKIIHSLYNPEPFWWGGKNTLAMGLLT